jgi:Leucine-rich repeat (LRR) protein
MQRNILSLILCIIIATGMLAGCTKDSDDAAVKKVEDAIGVKLSENDKQAVKEVQNALNEDAKQAKNDEKQVKVTINNKYLELSIRDRVSKVRGTFNYDGDLFQSDLDKITELSLDQKDSIVDIDKLTNLKVLKLTNCIRLTDLSPVKGCKNLEQIYIVNTNITDFSALSTLTKLKDINLYSAGVSDSSFLRNLTDLEKLHLEYTKISDISSLKNLTKLKELDISRTAVTSIDDLNGLVNLTKLTITEDKISKASIDAFKKAIPSCLVKNF